MLRFLQKSIDWNMDLILMIFEWDISKVWPNYGSYIIKIVIIYQLDFAPNIYFINYKILYLAQNFVRWGKVSTLPNNLYPCFHGCSDVCLVASLLRQAASPYLIEKGGEDVHDWQVQNFIHGKVKGENLVCCEVRYNLARVTTYIRKPSLWSRVHDPQDQLRLKLPKS